ncbi:co-chaperone YbbN [Ornithinimicrobium sp. INDO-MA30-4]|uniref:co-chaperone YbbN n=1 Tax=Ornithinimicrobium sp. INDO-MA30-4 TaxID=2908651 RepID=UPI001F293551|nr:tetratricopeptide repeat protein [Ornithinimicrobium sp. INDO-MA30-4]UJH70655.1 tetratricopeptide repeat protein [Ornithinimicrobium sp. INDO-MA30-4]
MSQQPFSAAALRGAVDLSGLGKKAPAAPAAGTNAADVPLAEGTDATFEAVVTNSKTVPTVLVLWSEQLPESLAHAQLLAKMSKQYQGRFAVVGINLEANPGILQALTPALQQTFGQVDALPVVMGLLQGQPMPFYLGVQEEAALGQLFDKFLEAAVANGVEGRVNVGEASDEPEEDEEELPAMHQQAYDAIERADYPAAESAYESALAANPADEEAKLGLNQVKLLARTADLDLTATRAAAAANPSDVQAQMKAADLDLVGGHVEDAFNRMIDTVRITAGDERTTAREHLLSMFEVIGTSDPRVNLARRALTNALF